MKIHTASGFTDVSWPEIWNRGITPCGIDKVVNPYTPLESPLEYELELAIGKYIPDEARIVRQLQIPTYRGTFRVDLVVQCKEIWTGFECDGRQYHDWSRDIFRDAVILNHSPIRSIYRIEGSDIFLRPETALFVIGKHHPYVFSERGMTNLWVLSECRDRIELYHDQEGIYADYIVVDEEGNRKKRHLRIRLLSNDHEDFDLMLKVAKRYKFVKTEDLWGIMLREVSKA